RRSDAESVRSGARILRRLSMVRPAGATHGSPLRALYQPRAVPYARLRLIRAAIHVTETALRVDAVAHELLEALQVGEAAVALAPPDQHAGESDLEPAAGARPQHPRAEILGKGRQQLLRHPRGAQQPLALPAIGDRDARPGGHRAGHGANLAPRAPPPRA